MATLEQQLEAAHAATTAAIDAVHAAAFGDGDVSAAYAEQVRIEAERQRLEAEYEAEQAAWQGYFDAKREGMQ